MGGGGGLEEGLGVHTKDFNAICGTITKPLNYRDHIHYGDVPYQFLYMYALYK